MKRNAAAVADGALSAQAADIDLGHFAPYLLSRLHTHFQNLLLDALSPFGLLVADWRTLICLSRSGTAHISDIVRFTSLPQATASRSVGRLQKMGLLMKSEAQDDKRASVVRLSSSGRKLLQQLVGQLDPAVQAEMARLLGSNSELFIQWLREAVRQSGLEIMHDL